MNRKLYIDFEKCILIINVLVIHLIFIYGDNDTLRMLHRLCIPQFAVICAYNLNFSIDKPLFKTWLKVISHILFIYFWSVLFTYLVFENKCDVKGTLNIMLSGYFHPRFNLPVWYAPYYICLWTISILIIKFVNFVSKYIGNLLNKTNYFSYILLLIFAIVCAMVGFSNDGVNQYFIKQALITEPFVFLGYILFKLDDIFDNFIKTLKIKDKIILYSFIILILIIFSIIFHDFSIIGGTVDIAPFIIEDIMNFYITSIIGGICLFVICKLICSIKILNPILSIFSYIGQKSMYICCFHQITQYIVFEYFAVFLNTFSGSASISLFMKVTITIITTIAMSYIFEKEKI